MLAEVPGIDWGTSLGPQADRSSTRTGRASRARSRSARSPPTTAPAPSAPTAPSRSPRPTGPPPSSPPTPSSSPPARWSRTIPGFDVDGTVVVTSDEMLDIPELPATAVVIGGGAIGCEFASMLADLGTKVTILEGLPKILPGCDDDVTKVVVRALRQEGHRHPHRREGHRPHAQGRRRHRRAGRGRRPGRGRPRRASPSGAARSRSPSASTAAAWRSTSVASSRSTSTAAPRVDGVWAIGDLIATPALAHVGFAEAIVAIQDILGEAAVPVDYAKVPWCIYCSPEVAFAGYSEQAAKDAGYDVVTYTLALLAQRPGHDRRPDRGHGEGHRREGPRRASPARCSASTWSAPGSPSSSAGGYLAVNWEATVDEVAHFIQPHPTLTRGLRRGVPRPHRTRPPRLTSTSRRRR